MIRLVCIASILTLSAHAAWADGNAKSGAQKIKTLQCQSCHGKDGLSKLPGAPNLAGQAQDYLIAALGAYRSEDRKNEIMNTVAKPLTDADIADLTAYYASLQITVKPPAP
ncbi:c-type cytochrome [Lichenifustis flavocetrariae]|uniref:Cytochrome c n=1 Tax=Lichenifustis flavocetrariae TaxID=2949735 RepID=A0AA41YUX5_9HYPH|nr:cytochrome c [Lichenifustis flavocetrariae]MCW6507785.1 cytochrome c [Lichenifustis flavocetrariae]